MEHSAGIFWDRGGYEINQDSVSFDKIILRRRVISMIVVADGIGGLSDGENASGIVTGRIVKWFYLEGAYLMIRPRAEHLIKRSLERLLFSVHKELEKYAQKTGKPLGTTCTILFVTGRKYMCAHIGDSRCMLIKEKKCGIKRFLDRASLKSRGGSWMWLTKDDVSNENELTKCVGSMGMFRPQWRCGRIGLIDRHTRFLVCSDGFYRKTGGEMIAESLSSAAMKTSAQIERSLGTVSKIARNKGEADNITAVCIVT